MKSKCRSIHSDYRSWGEHPSQVTPAHKWSKFVLILNSSHVFIGCRWVIYSISLILVLSDGHKQKKIVAFTYQSFFMRTSKYSRATVNLNLKAGSSVNIVFFISNLILGKRTNSRKRCTSSSIYVLSSLVVYHKLILRSSNKRIKHEYTLRPRTELLTFCFYTPGIYHQL